MRRKSLLAAFLIVVFSVSIALPAYADDSDTTEYSVLYHGNYSDEDAHRFSYLLYYLGRDGTWNGATQWSTAPGERDVNHWDYTNGYPGVDPYQGANKADILYTSGHGWPNLIRMYQPRTWGDTTRELDQRGVPDNVGADAGVVSDGERVNWEIGVDWTGTYRTISRWDDDLEWAFLASCSQLSSTGDSRLRYARTLLGDPHRAHAVWGYDATAPGDGVDVNVVNRFFNLVGTSYSIRYAWLMANYNYSQYSAAGVVHYGNQYEGLPPISAAYADSRVGTTPRINYWRIPEWSYVTQPVTQHDSGLLDKARCFVGRLLGIEEASARAADTYVGAQTTYRLSADIPELTGLPVLKTSAGKVVIDAASRDEVLGGATHSEVIAPDQPYEAYRGPAGILQTWSSGAQSVMFSGEATMPVGITRAQAIETATTFVEEHGGMPDDARLAFVRAFASSEIDPEDGALGSESVAEYIVEFARYYDDVEIAGVNGDGIFVVVDANGVRQYERNWRTIEDAEMANGPQAHVTATEALGVLAEEGDRYLSMSPEVEITDIDLVYYSMGPECSQSAMFPTWRITLDESDHFYVNAVTGRATNE